MLGVHLVHRGEVPYVREIHVHFHDIGERLVRGTHYGFEVAKDLLRLRDNATLDQFARGGILSDLAARVHAIAVANGRGEWTDWFGEMVGGDWLERHVEGDWEGE